MRRLYLILIILISCSGFAQLYLETPKNINEYKELTTVLRKQRVGYFNMQTMRERVLYTYWQLEDYRKEVLKDYLASIKREYRRGYLITEKLENRKLGSPEDLFSVLNAYEKYVDVSGKELPIRLSQVEYSTSEGLFQMTGSMNGGRKRMLGEIQFNISQGRRVYIKYLYIMPRLRTKGHSLELFKLFLEEHPGITEISGEFAETNLDVFFKALMERTGTSNMIDAMNELKEMGQLYAQRNGDKIISSVGIMDANTGRNKQVPVYSVDAGSNDEFSRTTTESIEATPGSKMLSKLGYELKSALIDATYSKAVRNATWVKTSTITDPLEKEISDRLYELEGMVTEIKTSKDFIRVQFLRDELLELYPDNMTQEQLERTSAISSKLMVQEFRLAQDGSMNIEVSDQHNRIQRLLLEKTGDLYSNPDLTVDAALDILLEEGTAISPQDLLIIIEINNYLRGSSYNGKYKNTNLIELLDNIASFSDKVNRGKIDYVRSDFERARSEARKIRGYIQSFRVK